MSYTVPNWAQALIARAAGLDPDKLMVCNENDRNISFLQHFPRADIIVSKVTGEKTVTQDKYANQRGRDGRPIGAGNAVQLTLGEA